MKNLIDQGLAWKPGETGVFACQKTLSTHTLCFVIGGNGCWFTNELDGIGLMVIATQFEQAAKEALSPDLRKNLAHASVKLAEVGLSKMR